jgi:hypothetical protein
VTPSSASAGRSRSPSNAMVPPLHCGWCPSPSSRAPAACRRAPGRSSRGRSRTANWRRRSSRVFFDHRPRTCQTGGENGTVGFHLLTESRSCPGRRPNSSAAAAGSAPPTCAPSATAREPSRWGSTTPTTAASRSSGSSTRGARSTRATCTFASAPRTSGAACCRRAAFPSSCPRCRCRRPTSSRPACSTAICWRWRPRS